MTERQQIAILTAIQRAQNLDEDVSVLAAIAIVRGGMGEAELLDAIATILPLSRMPQAQAAVNVLHDVDYVLALQGAARQLRERNQ